MLKWNRNNNKTIKTRNAILLMVLIAVTMNLAFGSICSAISSKAVPTPSPKLGKAGIRVTPKPAAKPTIKPAPKPIPSPTPAPSNEEVIKEVNKITETAEEIIKILAASSKKPSNPMIRLFGLDDKLNAINSFSKTAIDNSCRFTLKTSRLKDLKQLKSYNSALDKRLIEFDRQRDIIKREKKEADLDALEKELDTLLSLIKAYNSFLEGEIKKLG